MEAGARYDAGMNLIRPVRLLIALSLLLPAGAVAALVEYTGGGSIVEIVGPAPDNLSTDPATNVEFSFVFDLEREPLVRSEDLVTYEALTAFAVIDGGQAIPLTSATLMMARQEGYQSYLFEGVSEEGWILRYYVESRDPAFLPSFDLPEQSPQADDTFASISLEGSAGEWTAYSDNIPVFSTEVIEDENPSPSGLSIDLSLPLLGDLSLHLGRP